MKNRYDIPNFIPSWEISLTELDQLVDKEQYIPGAIHYSIKRYGLQEETRIDESGIIKYHCKTNPKQEPAIELRFCLKGKIYCKEKDCSKCRLGKAANCPDNIQSVDLLTVKYSAEQLLQFFKSRDGGSSGYSATFFKYKAPFEKQLPVCCKTRGIIEGLLSHSYSGSLENIYVNAQLQLLLLFSLDGVIQDPEERGSVTCSFLANKDDKDKIIKARELLIQHIGEPITIKDLSRKVAINECYLKKGFKQLFGTTIFDFYQGQRMEHAKYLLYDKGLTVTEVSIMLGYSSISHFSTAFKKQTGLKPCELLLR